MSGQALEQVSVQGSGLDSKLSHSIYNTDNNREFLQDNVFLMYIHGMGDQETALLSHRSCFQVPYSCLHNNILSSYFRNFHQNNSQHIDLPCN